MDIEHFGYISPGRRVALAYVMDFFPTMKQQKSISGWLKPLRLLRWLVGLRDAQSASVAFPEEVDAGAAAIMEQLEVVLEELGTIHDRKYDAEEKEILSAILQTENGTLLKQVMNDWEDCLGIGRETQLMTQHRPMVDSR